MAVVTLRFGSFENEAAWYGCDFDNVSGNVVAVRFVNTTASPMRLLLVGLGQGPAGRSRDVTVQPAAGSQVISIPGGQQPRYPLEVDTETGLPVITGFRVNAWWPA
jgi:hypothetical protein